MDLRLITRFDDLSHLFCHALTLLSRIDNNFHQQFTYNMVE